MPLALQAPLLQVNQPGDPGVPLEMMESETVPYHSHLGLGDHSIHLPNWDIWGVRGMEGQRQSKDFIDQPQVYSACPWQM